MSRDLTNLQRATIAWGDDMPDYIKLLAREADRLGQRGVGEKIDRSNATISKLINRCYTGGSYEECAVIINAAFGSNKVDCPLFGDIPIASCVRNRRRKGHAINALQRQFAAACPSCPLNPDKVTSPNKEMIDDQASR